MTSVGAGPTPAAVREAVHAFRSLPGADMAWLAVRESRSRVAVIRCAAGVDRTSALGLRIEPGVGAGGSVLAGGPPWRGTPMEGDDGGLSREEQRFLVEARVAAVIVVPLRSRALWTEALRLEGLVYVGRRGRRPFGARSLTRAVALGERLARSVRDAQRLEDARAHLAEVAPGLVDAAPDHRLDTIAHAIAENARVTLRSVIGIVFRLDRASGALHALGVDGVDLPVVKRGQVLPPGCGSAGQAVARRATFVADHYAPGTVRVPPIMAEAIPRLQSFTTLSTPLIVEDEVIGALTVSRQTPVPYDPVDQPLIEEVAALAAPILARAQRESDGTRRQQGASELSRLAGSLTESLTAEAVCERLAHAVVSLVHGADGAVWDAQGRMVTRGIHPAGLLREPTDGRLRRLVDLVMSSGERRWTPDLTNDPRLAGPEPATGDETVDARAVLAVPVRTRDTSLGVLAVTGETGRAFTDADKELAQGLADQAALALANARAYHDLEVSRAAMLRHGALRRLTVYRWPGNVRELEAVIEEAMILKVRGWLRPQDLSIHRKEDDIAVTTGPAATTEASRHLGRRQQVALEIVHAHGAVTRSQLATACGISGELARRELQALARLGLLRRTGQGRGTRYGQP